MNCNCQIHEELKNMMESMCPFCDQLLVEVNKAVELCCGEKNIENVNGMNICVNCGLVHSCDYVMEYFDFYDKIHLIQKKSIYHRKYCIDNVLYSVCSKNNIQLTHEQREQIQKVFVEINNVLHKVGDGRKRIMSIKYIIKQLFKMLGLPYKDINVTKSKSTLKSYEQYWEKIQSLIGDRIQSMVNV